MASWSDYVAVSFVFNSTFPVLGEENDLKFGPVEYGGGEIYRGTIALTGVAWWT
jgi:hypothetical protein